MKHFETSGDFFKRLLVVAAPVAAQNIITTGVNLVDTMMLGQLGEVALSASSLGTQFISLFLFFCMGISMGTSVLVSRYWGAKNLDSLKKVITIAMRLGIALALVFTVVNAALPAQIIRLYNKESQIIEAGAIYLRWSTVTYLLTALSLICTNVLRCVGLNRIPFLASMSSFMINIGANYVLIFGKFGAPAMGIAGAALGTVIARVVETAIIGGYLFFADKRVCYRIVDLFKRSGDMLGEFMRTSFPVILSDGLLGIGDSVLAMIMGHIGSQFVAANAITLVVQRVSTFFITGVAQAGCIITGQTLGQGDVRAAKRQGNTFFVLGAVIGSVAGLVIYLIRTPIINGYSITPETRLITENLMDAISIIVVFRATNSILTKGVLRGGGDTRFLLLADMLTMWLVAIPLGAMAGLVWKLSPFWIFVCLHADQIIKAVSCVFRLHGGKWIKAVKGVAFTQGEEKPECAVQ